MLASLRFTIDDRDAVAVLDDLGHWNCPGQPAIAGFLNVAFPADLGPEHGQAGHAAAASAAKALNGTVEFPRRNPPPDGAIF